VLQEAYWPARFPCSAIELGRDRVCGRGRVRDRLARNETRGANRGNERKCVSHPACGCLRDENQTQEGRDPQGTDPHRGRPHRGRQTPEGATHTRTRGATHTGDRERPTQGQGARPTQETHRHAPTARSRWTLCVRNKATSKIRWEGAAKHTQDNTNTNTTITTKEAPLVMG